MKTEKKKKSSFFGRLFGSRNKELSFMEEEQLQSPGRTMVRNFLNNKLGMTGLIVFLIIFLFVLIGPTYLPIDLSHADNTQVNVPPTLAMMKLPEELEGNVLDITPGTTFGVGVDNNGKVYTWGHTKITDVIDLKDIPEEVQQAKIVQIAAGYDHIAAVDENGRFYVWGNDRLGQAMLPSDITTAMMMKRDLGVKQLEAGFQFTAAVTEDGKVFLWGNGNMADIKIRREYMGQVDKIAVTSYGYVSLLKDGSVAYTGLKKDVAIAQIPEELVGRTDIVDIAASRDTIAAVDASGKVYIWGNVEKGLGNIPEMSSKPVELYGGSNHYTALLEDGNVVSWGDDFHGQSTVPAKVNEAEIATIFSGFYQNYAITTSGETITWGLDGYLFGSDNLGRDILTRIVNGGQVTMTVGAIAVVISLIIGIILGGIAGYFGGWVDMCVMRVAEVVGGLPFIPFSMILSAVIGTSISVEQRMYLIMVVLGVLSWPGTCRLIRAQILSQREQEYVTAAKAMGVRERSIVFRHIMPNILSLILVSATLDFATCMLTESTLSYLGFGIAPPTPTWGNMLTGANNSVVIQQYWWRWVFPATVFGICTICINLVGDALRDAVDPKTNGR